MNITHDSYLKSYSSYKSLKTGIELTPVPMELMLSYTENLI